MFTDEDNESDEDDDDDEEDTVQQLSTFGGHVNRGNKGLGLPDQNKSVKEYSDFIANLTLQRDNANLHRAYHRQSLKQ